MVTFQVESFAATIDEARPLLRAHWVEIALDRDAVPLDVDEVRYRAIEAAGIFMVVTARDERRALVGYAAFVVCPHLHYRSTLFATADVFWLSPAHRRGLTGLRLFRAAEEALRARGVRVINLNEKLHIAAQRGSLGPLFARLGYRPAETIFRKVL